MRTLDLATFTLAGLFGLAASAATATTLPADLVARAGQLRKEAPRQVLAWVDEQARPLARSRDTIDVAPLEAAAKAKFGKKQAASAPTGTPAPSSKPTVLGDLGSADIEALAFLVLMEAAKSAQEDLKAIMDGVKAINAEKSKQRGAASSIQKAAPTPTPVPDRATELLAAAPRLVDRTRGAQLSRVVPR